MTNASFAMDILYILARYVHPVYFCIFKFPTDTSIHSVQLISNRQFILSSSDQS